MPGFAKNRCLTSPLIIVLQYFCCPGMFMFKIASIQWRTQAEPNEKLW